MKITRFDWGKLARVLGAHGLEDAPSELESIVGVLDLSSYLEIEASGGGYVYSPTGRIRAIVVADPAAGGEFSIVVPVNLAWEILTFFGQLVTSAVAANRLVRLTWQDAVGGNTIILIPDVANQPASTTRVYSFGRGVNSRQSAGGLGEVAIDIPQYVTLGPGFEIRTVVGNVQAADQWSRGLLLVREWPA